MGRQLTHAEAAELLGPLALDALEPDERNDVETHVVACRACQAELSDHREVAALLTGWVAAPDGLWDRIASSLEEVPPPYDLAPVLAFRKRSPTVEATPVSGRQGRGMRVMAASMVAASVLVFGAMTSKIVGDGRRLDTIVSGLQGDELQRAAKAASADPDARRVSLRSDDGLYFADAVLLDDGTGFVVKDNLPTLNADRSYQLWAVVGDQTISVGVLGSEPERVAFRATGPVQALAITEEVAGGVEKSGVAPVVAGVLTV